MKLEDKIKLLQELLGKMNELNKMVIDSTKNISAVMVPSGELKTISGIHTAYQTDIFMNYALCATTFNDEKSSLAATLFGIAMIHQDEVVEVLKNKQVDEAMSKLKSHFKIDVQAIKVEKQTGIH